MKRPKPGRRHILLLYRRMMDRLWGPTLALGILMLILWFWSDFFFPELPFIYVLALLIGAVIVLAFSVFAFLARKMGYVQAYPDHLRIVTPFLLLKISYRRLINSYPSEFFRLFPPTKTHWAEHRFLEPFYERTALVVEVSQYPIKPSLLRLFLLPQMFLPQSRALVLVVQDWMALSTEIDSALGSWKQSQSINQKIQKGGYGIMGTHRKR